MRRRIPLSLLALAFAGTLHAEVPAPRDTPYAPGTIRLEVECIEARLSDLGPAWAAGAKPDHDKPDSPASSR